MDRPIFLWDVLHKLLMGSLALFIAITFWVFSVGFLVLNLFLAWFRLWRWLGVWNLVAIRFLMRWRNLYDTSKLARPNPDGDPRALRWDSRYLFQRTADGTFNDLEEPRMGSANTRFARNVPFNRLLNRSDIEKQLQDPGSQLLTPNPREVSRQLLTRDRFKPATSLNLLAAAWIQFQVHDWFNHRRQEPKDHKHYSSKDHIAIPLDKGDPWPDAQDEPRDPQRPGQRWMWIRKTEADSTREPIPSNPPQPDDPPDPPTFINTETHWWDGSQLYGSSPERQGDLRAFTGGKLQLENLEKDGKIVGKRLPPEKNKDFPGVDLTGFNDNWWVGLSLFHTLFALEHNVICDRLIEAYPGWDDERLFQTARLINVAVMAKIHTVEWTPAILGHPTLLIGMRANWWGILTERLTKSIGRFKILGGVQEEISGIPASEKDHHTAPYYLTEEFVAVYRMHPLIPDRYRFYSAQNDELLTACSLGEIHGNKTRDFMKGIAFEDLFYSFGLAHPGAVTLNNFPRALQQFTRIKEGSITNERLDLGAIDVMRDRERAVPRYNQFRRFLLMLPAYSYRRLVGLPLLPWFSSLTKREIEDRKKWAKELEQLYPDPELLDLMVGLFAEKRPKGFGFSETAFRIFVLMAPRRLKSDRFFTTDYKPEVYTPIGIDWIDKNGLKSLLQRHFPALSGTIADVANPFIPWQRVEQPSPDPTAEEIRSLAYKPLFSGAAAGWMGGALVYLHKVWLEPTPALDKFIQAPVTSEAGWGAMIGAIIGAMCMGIVNLLSYVLSGKLSSRERAEVSGSFGCLAGWFAGAVHLYANGPVGGGLIGALASPEARWGAAIGLVAGAAYSGIRDWAAFLAEGKSIFKIVAEPLGWISERALFFALSGGILGLISGLLVTLYGYLHDFLYGLPAHDGATFSAVALGILIGAGAGLMLAVAGRVVIGVTLTAFGGWIVGASLNLLSRDHLRAFVAALSDPLAGWLALAGLIGGAFWGASAGRCLRRNAAWILIGACRGGVIGFVLGAALFLGHLVFGDDAAFRAIVAALQSPNARVGAAVGAIIAAVAWLYWPSELSWVFRRSFWNLWGWMKFVFNKPQNITPPPEKLGTLRPEPLRTAIPDIPIGSIQAVPENQIPADERYWLQSFVYKIQVWLYWAFSPMQPGLYPIAADPQWALNHAYRRLQRKTFDPPDLPPEYEGSPDLGSLAVRGPYACYTEKLDDGLYLWDLRKLEEYGCQDGLYQLGARVLFHLDLTAGRLVPCAIESALGTSQPADSNWQLAKKLALCSVTTHLSLVRHFNWVHLASGAHLAVATRNCLPKNHPLCRLLWPHIYGTQQSNDTVTRGQMVPGGDFETIFSFAYGGMCRLFEDSYRDFRIVVNDPEQGGTDRGVRHAGFETPTQQNMEDLFGVIHEHARNYLGMYYPDNPPGTRGTAILTDEPVLKWLDELNRLIPNGVDVARGNVTFTRLCLLVARFIYMVTVQHEMVGSFLWNYQLWTHRQPVRVYKNGQREPLDVYQRLVNANYNLNVDRRLLMDDFSCLALDANGRAAFGRFQSELAALQKRYEDEPWEVWRMYPKTLKVNINA